MPLSLLYSLIGIFAVWISKTPSMAEGLLAVNSAIDVPLIENASDILCSFHTKVVYVYFENKTSSGYSGDILRDLSDCGTSYITLRNRVKTKPLELINNDGILLYLVMIFHDASQRIDLSIIQKYSAAKHLSHVMMLIVNSETVTEAWLRHTFAIFWHIWFLNVVIMFQRNNELHVYRYNPFTDEFLIKLELSSGVLPRKDDLFPPKLPDMGGKPLSVCLYQDEVRAIFEDDDDDQKVIGSDGFMSAFIAERLNATRVIHRVSRFGNFMLRADICFKEITHELDDVAFNTRFLAAPTFARQVEYTIVHSRDDLSSTFAPHNSTRLGAMPLSLLYSLIGIFAVWISKTPSMAEGLLAVNSAIDVPLIENASDILCSFHTKVVYVYFENKTSSGYSGDILRDLSDCGTSYITLRNRVKTKPLELINNDGILLYLVMIFHDASQRIDLSIIQKYS
ncbi:PREDICTED: uncharacterized protein LOC108377629, partial [Rhagoletis zephyria]|uniref:uncharacterized protein LOC108377629 n=1 Tax=Rhagoletis zephyria TaxID=28612 RepID=UPI00081131D5